MLGCPLGEIPNNMIRRISHSTSLSTEDQTASLGVHILHPVRQPENAPQSDLAQRDSGFARFLKQHSSPTHQRVTAGGRIVPMVRSQPPPAFSLTINNQQYRGVNPGTGFFTPARDFNEQKNTLGVGEAQFSKGVGAHVITASGNNSLDTSNGGSRKQENTDSHGDDEINGPSSRKHDKEAPSASSQPPQTMPANMWLHYTPVSTMFMPAIVQNPDFLGQSSLPSYPQGMLYQPSMLAPQSLDSDTSVPNRGLDQQGYLPSRADERQDRQLMSSGHNQLTEGGAGPSLNYLSEQLFPYNYGASVPWGQTASSIYAQSPVLSAGAGYQPWLMPISSMPHLSGSNSETQGLPGAPTTSTLAKTVGNDRASDQPSRASSLHGHGSTRSRKTPLDLANDKFETLSRHLRELDQFIAMHGNKLNAKIKEEKVRERVALVEKRALARDSMNALAKQPKNPNEPLAQFGPILAQPRPSIDTNNQSKDTRGAKVLNVEAPPWVPKGKVQIRKPRCDADDLKRSTINSNGPDEDHDNEIAGDTNDQDSVLIQTHDDSPKHSLHSLRRMKDDGERASMTTKDAADTFACLQTTSKIIPNATGTKAGTPDHAVSSLGVEEDGILRLSPSRQTAANHEMILDALRLPKGCVTRVDIIGGAETMVHGQGLKQPPWVEIPKYERDYWIRKPDHLFYQRAIGSSPQVENADALAHREADSSVTQDDPSKAVADGWMAPKVDDVSLKTAAIAQSPPITQETQQPKGSSSVAMSAITAHAKISPKDGGLSFLRQNTAGGATRPKRAQDGKRPPISRGLRAAHDMGPMAFFRGFWPSDDDCDKIRREGSPF
ncbi:hypothetical protein UCRPC4_g06260 [Phaeomoniella chlamydospora]|uniref:Uncharacterized protein n=1 Tax=Phaeomoniella chlamydospora TaxID=158046 RepID=A0A0G2FUQ3_PHACM|nr:hypothetical protein UCRPC4_g06260 [Phaeomoniella chlamydospora]